MDLFLATSSSHKAQELQEMLLSAGIDIEVYAANQVGGMPLVEETEPSLEGNARLKAQALKSTLPQNAWVLADDSGLFVDALDGAPGVYSGRFAGNNATDKQNRSKLLKMLEGVDPNQRGARFLCCFVLLHSGIHEVVFLASVRGVITESERGSNGFGYDSLFIAKGQNKTFAEIEPELKNQISHRAYAIKQLVEWLQVNMNLNE
jgi:non-canonical purine NTP pyrophosphatase (RdgB/HAM1 family)